MTIVFQLFLNQIKKRNKMEKYEQTLEVIKEYYNSIDWAKLRKVESFEKWVNEQIIKENLK